LKFIESPSRLFWTNPPPSPAAATSAALQQTTLKSQSLQLNPTGMAINGLGSAAIRAIGAKRGSTQQRALEI